MGASRNGSSREPTALEPPKVVVGYANMLQVVYGDSKSLHVHLEITGILPARIKLRKSELQRRRQRVRCHEADRWALDLWGTLAKVHLTFPKDCGRGAGDYSMYSNRGNCAWARVE